MSKSSTRDAALKKLTEAAYRFSKDRDGLWLQNLDGSVISRQTFREQLKSGINCKLSDEELTSLMTDFERDGLIDGTKFCLFFSRLRYELKSKLQSDLLANRRKMKEMQRAEEIALKSESAKMKVDISMVEFTEDEKRTALDKIKEAAYKYDRLMPGAVQLDAFEAKSMLPIDFKEQLSRVFKIHVNQRELAALMSYFDKDADGNVTCAEFLITFFRLGFEEKSRRLKELRLEQQRFKEDRDRQQKEEQDLLEKKNSLKVNFVFSKTDKESALKKLREAAKLYESGVSAMKAFSTISMEPHVFKEQLKRAFNLKVTAPELGALMKVFDVDGDGTISCAEFSKIFVAMGFAEREREIREFKEKNRLAEEARKAEAERKEQELAMKNASKLSYKYTEESFSSALAKLTEAAWAFDKNGPGAPDLTAFEAKDMEPHVFKEQLRRAFNMNLNPQELGALMTIFDPEKKGTVICIEFLNKFLKVGMDERARRWQQWRDHELELEKSRAEAEAQKKKADDEKHFIKLREYSDDQYETAVQKLTQAAAKYIKGAPGAVSLTAFEAQTMLPHVFKEQLKLVFGLKVTIPELSALLHFFGNDEELTCREFVVKFVRMGIEERQSMRKKWKEDDKAKKEKADKLKEEILIKNGLRGVTEVNKNFVEEDFDSALGKLIDMCYRFDARNAGPGFRKIFEANFFTPGEFKEILKRTFNVRVTAAELGVFVSYFDTSMSGNITTSSFMSSFLKIRISLEDIKGSADEKVLLQEFQKKMKVSYKKRIERLTSLTNDSSLKPWRSNLPVTAFDRKQHKPYPKSAAHKLRRRLNVGLRSGKLDLSTQLLWLQGIEVTTDEEEIVAEPVEDSQNLLAEEMKEDVQKILKRTRTVDLVAQGKSKLQMKAQQDLNMLSSLISLIHTEKRVSEDRVVRNLAQKPPEDVKIGTLIDKNRSNNISINFRLASIPPEVFNMLSLRELWLCNNELGSIPSQIGELKLLQVLSLAGNKLQTIPPEICLIETLTKLYLERNCLEGLPDLFGRLHNLDSLNISSNQFKVFPEVVCSLSLLVNLDAESNEISSLPSSLRAMKSLTRLNLGNNLLFSPEQVLDKMWWLSVVPSCAIIKTEKSASVFKVSLEESLAAESFLRNKASSRAARILAELNYKKETGLAYMKPKKVYDKIIMK